MADARYVSIPECAEVLNVSKDLVYELVTQGVLPAVELGRRKVVPVRALELVEERALEGFDPDSVLNRLAAAAGSSAAGRTWTHAADGDEGPTGTAEPAAVVPIR